MIIKKSNLYNILIYIAILFLGISNTMSNVIFIANYLIYVKAIALILLLFCTILNIENKYIDRKKIVLILLFLFIGILVYIQTKNVIFIEIVLMLSASVNSSFDRIVKYDLTTKLIITLFIIVCNQFGLAESQFIVTRDGEGIRNAFGFYHPNTFGMYLMMIYFEYIYLIRNNLKKRHMLLGLLLCIIIKLTSDTRSAYNTILLFIICIFFKKIFIYFSKMKVTSFLLKNSFLFFSGISIILTVLYRQNINIAIIANKILSGRLYLQAINLVTYGISLFGNNVTFIHTLDNGFFKLLINFGFSTFLMYIYIYYYSIKKSIKNNNYILTIIFFVIMFFTISESYMLYIYFNIFLTYVVTEDVVFK